MYNNDDQESDIDGVIPHASQQYAGDELYFTGYDMGQSRRPVLRHALQNEYWDGIDEMDSKDAGLVRSALDRIEKARTKGKTNVSLTTEEMAALGRSNAMQKPGTPPPQLMSPPATPNKSSKKSTGRSSSLTNMVVAKTRKKSSSPKAKPRSNSKAKMVRKMSTDAAPIFPTQPTPIFHPASDSVLVQGPDGVPVYAPLVYADDFNEPLTRSRSHSQGKRFDMNEQIYAPRYTPQQTARPSSSSAAYARQDEYYSAQPRAQSGSNAQPWAAEEYAQQRRNVSGPPEVSFSSLRRVPPASSPLVPRTPVAHSHSDPNAGARRGFARYEGESPSSSSDDQGVQVEILPNNTSTGYSISRKPVADSKRKKSKR